MNIGKRNIILLVPIENFDCEEEVIEINDAIKIRKFAYEERRNLLKEFPNYRLSLEPVVMRCRFVIEYCLEVKYDSEPEYGMMTDHFAAWGVKSEDIAYIKSAFRLLKMEAVNMPTAFYLSTDSVYVSNPSPKLKNSTQQPRRMPKKEIEEFVTLSKALLEIEQQKPHLEFALFQFNRAIEEASVEGKLFDIVTAFESIVFGRGKNAPSPYGRAIGIAIAMLIGKSEDERSEIEQKLNEAYEIRNLVVHGHLRKKLEDADEDGHENLETYAQDYLRRSLIRLLEE